MMEGVNIECEPSPEMSGKRQIPNLLIDEPAGNFITDEAGNQIVQE
jgi:hypothetical protein